MNPPRLCGRHRINFKSSSDQSDDSEVGGVRGAKTARILHRHIEAAADIHHRADAARKCAEARAVIGKQGRPFGPSGALAARDLYDATL